MSRLPHTTAYLNLILSSANASTTASLSNTSEADASSLKSSSSSSGSNDLPLSDDSAQSIIDILEDTDLPEDDKPDVLKDMLASHMSTEAKAALDLDSVVLSLMHRHREDLAPTGQTFPLPVLQPKANISRSSSFRRTFTPNLSLTHRASAIGLNMPGSGPPSRPHSPSPLRVQTPQELDNDLASMAVKHLNVTASEFRPRVTSSGSPASQLGGLPVGPSKSVWGVTGSPLGTPRYSAMPTNDSPASSYSQSGSYFPLANSQHRSSIPRDPWSSSTASLPGLTAAADEQTAVDQSLATNGSALVLAKSTGSLASLTAEQSPMLSQARDDESFPGDFSSEDLNDQLWEPEEPSNQPGIGMTGASAVYSMTPLDVLTSVFAEAGLSTNELEDALSKNGWEVDRAMEYLVSQTARHRSLPPTPAAELNLPTPHSNFDDATTRFERKSLSPTDSLPHGNFFAAPLPGARPQALSRSNSYDTRRAASPSTSAQWQNRPSTPTAGSPSYPSSAASNRVCRYYLQGSCLRSDCRYNHDISKAVCRFWLRGYCLKGADRCDFMHMIPPHLSQDVALLRLRLQASDRREAENEAQSQRFPREEEEEFPTLSGSGGRARRDPAISRWSAAVKSGRPILQDRNEPRRAFSSGQERQSIRIPLKPPLLLPTLVTGSNLSEAYAKYRSRFLELGAGRARSLSKAAEAWKNGDGAGARHWSKEAQAQDLERLQAGREAAEHIAADRKAQLKEAVMRYDNRNGRADVVADRPSRGREAGGGLGIVLGIASKSVGSSASPEERAEAALDLHGLHAEEATDMIAKFLTSLERENFLGTAYLIIGQEKHTVHNQVRTRLAESVSTFLDQYKYPYRVYGGIFSIDALSHL